MDLQQSFLLSAPQLARRLLGSILVHYGPDGPAGGIIVETEAYLGAHDAAAHTFRGRTKRNAAMFGPPGRAYIYFSYGNHWCMNVTAGPEGVGEGILIRALEPTIGLKLMQSRRDRSHKKDLCSGPGKLTQALGITRDLYGHDLSQPPLQLKMGSKLQDEQIITTTRIGISSGSELPLRFMITGNSYVSRPANTH